MAKNTASSSKSEPQKFVGLDVHKETIAIAVANRGASAPRSLGVIRNDLDELRKTAAACMTVSLFYSAQEVLFNGGPPSSFETPLGVIASLLAVWGADARMDPTQAKRPLVAAIVVSLLLMGMLVALRGGIPAVRFLLTAAVVTVSVGAMLKLLGHV
jgi:uncharacterized membrane protein